MSSSTTRKLRGSRTGEIPHNFILKWQSSGPKPLIRRPMTACQACRTAKVKCDNQPQCHRCNSRDIVCRYTNIDALDTPPPSNLSSAIDIASPSILTQTTPEEIPIDSNNVPTHLSMDTTTYDQAFETMADWTPDGGHQALDDFAWPPLDTNLNVRYSSNATDMINRTSIFAPKDQSLITTTPQIQTNFGSNITMASTNGLSQADQLFSLPKCQCRESLVTLVPRVETAMQEKQLDEVFKGMQRVVDGFQDIVQCTECNITCVDLICIMAVFQQSGAGFEYIAKSDMGSAINMAFGGCEVPINDPKLRAMLVSSLIYQATTVLDAIRAKGQHMLQMLCPPSAMAQANIGHLDTVIGEFRNVLRRMADAADKAATPSKQVSSTLSTRIAADQTC